MDSRGRVLDLFSGILGFSLGFEEAGFETAAFSEVEPFPCRLIAHRRSGIPNLGDIRGHSRWPWDKIGRVGVVTFGSPCQDLSVAGKRAGLKGRGSGLFYEAVEIVQRVEPRFALWENVPGAFSSRGGRDFAAVLDALADLGALDIAWRVLDAQFFGVPQRRRRIFLVADFAGESAGEILFEPESLSRNPATSGKTGEDIAAPLTSGSGSRSRPGGRRQEDDFNIVAALSANGVGTYGADDNQAQAGHLLAEGGGEYGNVVTGSKTARYHKGTDSDVNEPLVFAYQGSNVGEFGTLTAGNGSTTGGVPFTTHALTAEGHDAGENGTGRGTLIIPFDTTQISSGENRSNPRAGDPCHPLAATSHPPAVAFTERTRGKDRNFECQEELSCALTNPGGGGRAHSRQLFDGVGVRRLTPLECERLQGFPDGWTDIPGASDSARYRSLGNAAPPPVVRWIAKRMARVMGSAI